MSPRIHPDVDPPTDPAVRVAIEAGKQHGFFPVPVGEGYRCDCGQLFSYIMNHREHVITVALDAARPVWAGQLAIAIEDTSKGEGEITELIWSDVAEFIRAREERS